MLTTEAIQALLKKYIHLIRRLVQRGRLFVVIHPERAHKESSRFVESLN